MPRVHNLQIDRGTQLDLFQNPRGSRFEQIRTLTINNFNFDDFTIEGWCRLFPSVNHLSLSCIQSRSHLIRFLDGFKHLLHASFEIESWRIEEEPTYYTNHELTVRGVRRLMNGTFTCRVYKSTNESPNLSVNLWIEEQVTSSIIFDLLFIFNFLL